VSALRLSAVYPHSPRHQTPRNPGWPISPSEAHASMAITFVNSPYCRAGSRGRRQSCSRFGCVVQYLVLVYTMSARTAASQVTGLVSLARWKSDRVEFFLQPTEHCGVFERSRVQPRPAAGPWCCPSTQVVSAATDRCNIDEWSTPRSRCASRRPGSWQNIAIGMA